MLREADLRHRLDDLKEGVPREQEQRPGWHVPAFYSESLSGELPIQSSCSFVGKLTDGLDSQPSWW